MKMSAEVITSGIYSTIQDNGRYGFRDIGVPVSGFMDCQSANLANAMLNNPPDSAVIESAIVGPSIKFHQHTYVVISGAQCEAMQNEKKVVANTVLEINKGDVLKIGRIFSGKWLYLAVAGGFQTERILGSRSFYKDISAYEKLQKGQILELTGDFPTIENRTHIKSADTKKIQSLEVYKGPEFDFLSKNVRHLLFSESFRLSAACNRMAYKMEKQTLIAAKEITTSSVQPGTVQLTPDGELIVLMRDCQTTGGYSRVLQLSDSALCRLAQKTTSETIRFVSVNYNG